VDSGAETRGQMGRRERTAEVRLVEERADFVAGCEAGYFWTALEDGAGAVRKGGYGRGAGERVLSYG
jgi:hypothetical protein